MSESGKVAKLGPYDLDQVHQGYVPGVLSPVPTESVHCVVTSPPYWDLRVYDGAEAQEWSDGSRSCLGLEEDPGAYVDHMLEVFREVHRVLRSDGTLWLNMGDCHMKKPYGKAGAGAGDREAHLYRDLVLKKKDLAGMPWRIALALQSEGWYLRRDIIWHKPSAMPESPDDRPTTDHEYVFILSKSEKYFYDPFAIREPSSWNSHPRGSGVNPKAKEPASWDTGSGGHRGKEGRYPSSAARQIERAFVRKRKTAPGPKQNESFSAAVSEVLPYRNKRSVWKIPTTPCKAAHFATFPPGLVIPMVRAGTSEKGVCGACGAPWRRVLAKTPTPREEVEGTKYSGAGERVAGSRIRESTKGARAAGGNHDNPFPPPEHVGWEPGCPCQLFRDLPLEKAVVLDPFAGTGTTIAVAIGLGRRGLGFEASANYVEKIVPDRIAGVLGKKALFKDAE